MKVSFAPSTIARALTALFVLLLAGCWGEPPIRIGFSGQLVGPYADLGVAGRNGAILAVGDINAQGGIAGRPVELLVQDDHDTPQGAIKADEALIEQGVVAIIGHMTSSQTMAALPLLREKGLVLISPTTSTSELTGLRDTFFRVQVSLDVNARGLADFIHGELKIQRVALLMDTGNQAYVQAFAGAFIASLLQSGGQLVLREEIDMSVSPDLTLPLRKVAQSGAQALCIVAPAPATAMIAQHARRIGLAIPLLFPGQGRSKALLEVGGHSVDGMYMADCANMASQKYKAFSSRYEQRFGKKAYFAAVRGYEATMLLAAALERTGGEAQGLPEALRGISDFSGVDSTIKLDEFGDSHRPSSIFEVVNGAFVKVGDITSGDSP